MPPDWLREAVESGDPVSPAVMLARVGLAVVLGFAVAGVYALTLGRRRASARTMPTTLVLLAVLIALVTMVIGNSVARAFGLVGALSIVRFRTVVEDTRDTAFVIFAVAVGMASGAGYGLLAAAAVPVVGAVAAVMGRFDRPKVPTGGPAVTLTVRLGLGHDPDVVLGEILARHLTDVRLTATATARQGVALDLTYAARLRAPGESPFPLVAELNRVEGVQSVELKRA